MKKTFTFIAVLALAGSAVFRLSARDEQPVVTPRSVIDLIDKAKFDTYPFHLNPKKSPTGKKSDVWAITPDGLHVIGNGFGYFRTNTRYRDYHLVMEYRWGEKTWKPRLDRARDCGLLLHAHGPDGSLSNGAGPAMLLDSLCGFARSADGADVIVAKGNCGVPKMLDGEIVYSGSEETMATYARMARDAGARIIGGCCGTTPGHLAAIAAALEGYTPGPVPEKTAIEKELGPIETPKRSGARRRERKRRKR